MSEVTIPADIASLSETQLDVLERKIAAKYLQVVPWSAVVWGFANCFAFLSLIPLVLLNVLPLWLGFLLATVGVMACYLPSHEAQHSIIASKGKPLRWLNELLGHVSAIPMVVPYRVLRATHMEHHAHCNDKDLDPDFGVHAESGWAFLKQELRRRVRGDDDAYSEALVRTGQEKLALDSVIYQFVFLGIPFQKHPI